MVSSHPTVLPAMRFQDMNELLGITPTLVLEPLTYQRLFIGYLFLNERNSLIDLFLFNLSLGFILLRYKIFFPLGMVRLPYPFWRVPTMRLKDSVSVSTNWRTSLIRFELTTTELAMMKPWNESGWRLWRLHSKRFVSVFNIRIGFY